MQLQGARQSQPKRALSPPHVYRKAPVSVRVPLYYLTTEKETIDTGERYIDSAPRAH